MACPSSPRSAPSSRPSTPRSPSSTRGTSRTEHPNGSSSPPARRRVSTPAGGGRCAPSATCSDATVVTVRAFLVVEPGSMPSALGRFRMLDLSRQLPGPFCSMLLADLGMDVLAVYAPNDPMGMGIPLLGRNKRSCSLNLKAPEGRAIFHRLVRDADVVLEGGRPGVAARLGVDYETLKALNPRLVYCSISGYRSEEH